MNILSAFYDLEHGPVSYDFVTWLVRAMKERDRVGAGGLHVVIVPKEDGLGGFSRHWGTHDEHAARWRLWHIVAACCPLAKATVMVAASRKQAEAMDPEYEGWRPQGKAHFAGPLVEAARKGENIPLLDSTLQARRYVERWLADTAAPLVTITLRRQDTDPARNSGADAAPFAAWLRQRGYCVMVIGDSNDALAAGRGYAELDPDLRLALYQRASMNVIGNNGPAVLLWHSRAPFLMFNAARPLETYREHWEKHLRLREGEQLPWAHRRQRLVYRPDTLENMQEAFDSILTPPAAPDRRD